MATHRDISVVIPTRGRPEALARCLEALERQTIPAEVMIAEDVAGRGPAAMRNAGAARATGDVLLFTDDDCIPEPDWAARLSAACPAGGAVAGETVNADEADAFAAASQLLTSGLQRSSLRGDGTLGFAPSSNIAVSRELLQRVPFDESFPAAAGEDRDWCGRVAAAGAPLRYEPRAVVRHRPRLGLGGFLRQQFRYGRGAARFSRSGGRLAPAGLRRRLLGEAFRARLRVGLLAVVAQVAVATGYLTERARR
jgi:GT2 family glycosyltransferase